jgi:hypothetical protein
VNRLARVSCAILLAAAAFFESAGAVLAGEPRPWLCRDKPVFSDSHPMQYEVSSRSGGWQIFFMQFEMNAAHDGFSIKDSRMLGPAPQTGILPPGQYYAVALYRKGSVWVCSYGEESSRPPGIVVNLCYGNDSSTGCLATLKVKPREGTRP